MCGICGVISERLSPMERKEAVTRMCDAMHHRGPDDFGASDFDSVCLGMRRLRIIDTSAQGSQPMHNEDGSVWVVFNGEIYNFRSLRAELARRGHQFQSKSDTEVLLHLYEEHEAECCKRLRGMFAFAIWDERRKQLLLGRDRLGIKPLYYAQLGDGWIFGSELRALLASNLLDSTLDLPALDAFLAFGYVPPPRTLVRGVKVLPPGHLMRIQGVHCTLERWWDFPEPGSRSCPDSEVVPRLRELLEESIQLHQISDVPLGAFLSGGVDSSAVVGLMSRLSNGPIRTFSIGFEDAPAGYDEREIARETARLFGTDHAEVVVKGSTVRDELERMMASIDQPSFDGLNTFLISQAAKEGGLTVSLSGLGGDEIFGGYDTYRVIPRWGKITQWWARIPEALRSTIAKGTMAAFGGNGISSAERSRKFKRLCWVDSPVGLYALARLNLWPQERDSLYADHVLAEVRGDPERIDVMGLLSSLAPASASSWRMVSLLEMQAYMGWRLLRDTDTMSMAHSLEIRVPLIDHEVVEFVCGLRVGWEKRWGHPKRLLTQSLEDILPAALLNRKKQGFAFPMEKWMNEDLREIIEEALSPASVRKRGLFSPPQIERLYRDFQAKRVGYPAIWQFVVLELWMREVLDRQIQVVG